jgi:Right handed beta helix region
VTSPRLLIALLVAAVAATALPATASAAGSSAAAPTAAAAKKKKLKKLTVCRRGCRFSSIQKAVNRAAKGATIRVKPGTYVEGVVVKGASKDKLKIVGTGKTAKKVVLEGKGAKTAGNPAQNGIFVDGADGVTMRNMTARNYPANGFFVRDCKGYLMDDVIAAFNRAYGLYAFNCVGGRMTHSTGYGHGDSAFYVGQTPTQSKPKTTVLDHLVAYENVLGYSGTNSKYMDIRNSEFFNNGAGIVPNTLESEKFPPASDGVIHDNLVYWNNFNYFAPSSRVKPLPAATGAFNYPTGAGVVLFGTTNWKVTGNSIFGNFKWGVFNVSDPAFAPATNIGNAITANKMGAAMGDANGVDFMTEGSGSGNCWASNSAGSTFDPGSQPEAQLYPVCGPTPAANALDATQLGEIAGYLTQGVTQEDSWVKHVHPARAGRTPIDGQTAR